MARLFALRGAITVDRNDGEEILGATERLMREIMQRNDLEPDASSAASSPAPRTSTPSSPPWPPAASASTQTPLLCAREMPVPGSLPRVIRALIHYYADEGHQPEHVYLGEARTLRADLDHAQ